MGDGTLAEIDLTACRYLGPLVVTYLATILLRGRQVGRQIAVRLPAEPLGLRAFCAFSGFSHLAGQGLPPALDHPQSETAPLVQTQTRWLAAKPIADLIGRHLGTPSPDFAEALGLCVREVFQNIEDHAASPIGGWYCARCLIGKRETRVAVVDRGVGIHATLVKRYTDIVDAREALRRVVAGDYTSLSKPRNAGQGISNLARQVERLRGRAVIITGDAWAELDRRQRWRYGQMRATFGGTAFFFALPVPAVGNESGNLGTHGSD